MPLLKLWTVQKGTSAPLLPAESPGLCGQELISVWPFWGMWRQRTARAQSDTSAKWFSLHTQLQTSSFCRPSPQHRCQEPGCWQQHSSTVLWLWEQLHFGEHTITHMHSQAKKRSGPCFFICIQTCCTQICEFVLCLPKGHRNQTKSCCWVFICWALLETFPLLWLIVF